MSDLPTLLKFSSLALSTSIMPAKQIQRKVHEESLLEGVSAKILFYDSWLCYHHGHDNALNNKTILKVHSKAFSRALSWVSHLEANLPRIIHANNQDDD